MILGYKLNILYNWNTSLNNVTMITQKMHIDKGNVQYMCPFLNVHFHIAPGWHSRFQLLNPFVLHYQSVVFTLTSRPRNHRNLQIAYSMVNKMSHYRLFVLIFYVSYMFINPFLQCSFRFSYIHSLFFIFYKEEHILNLGLYNLRPKSQ